MPVFAFIHWDSRGGTSLGADEVMVSIYVRGVFRVKGRSGCPECEWIWGVPWVSRMIWVCVMRIYVNVYDGAPGCPECEWARGNPMDLANAYVMFA